MTQSRYALPNEAISSGLKSVLKSNGRALKSNNKMFDERDINLIIENLATKPDGKYNIRNYIDPDKKSLDTDVDVIKLNGRYYAAAPPSASSSDDGSYFQLGQDLQSGEIVGIKNQTSVNTRRYFRGKSEDLNTFNNTEDINLDPIVEVRKTSASELQGLKALGIGRGLVEVQKSFFDEDTKQDIVTAYSSSTVMDLVPGPSLSSLIDKDELKPTFEEAQVIARDSLINLAKLHAAEFSHGDIMPANIRLDAAGVAKLIDCGSSSDVDAKGVANHPTYGNAQYSPPERGISSTQQAKFGKGSFAGDVCSLGFTLAELHGFINSKTLQWQEKPKKNPQKATYELFERMTDDDPSKRPTVKQALAELQKISPALSSASSEAPAKPAPSVAEEKPTSRARADAMVKDDGKIAKEAVQDILRQLDTMPLPDQYRKEFINFHKQANDVLIETDNKKVMQKVTELFKSFCNFFNDACKSISTGLFGRHDAIQLLKNKSSNQKFQFINSIGLILTKFSDRNANETNQVINKCCVIDENVKVQNFSKLKPEAEVAQAKRPMTEKP